jgi:CRP/FNR family cyclic AMP-dependent transcriptional regulator
MNHDDEERDALFPESFVQALVARGTARSFPKGAIIVHEGEHSDSLYVILSGTVKVYLADDSGKELMLNTQGPGEYFGEMILDDGPRSASVMTLEPCRMAVVSRDQFRQVLAEDVDGTVALVRSLIHRVRELTKTAGTLGLLDVYGRVVKLLTDLAVPVDGRMTIPYKLTQQDIASRIGCGREMVSRISKDLKAGGYLSNDDGHIVILKKPPKAW